MDELTGFSLYLLQQGRKRSTIQRHIETLGRLKKNVQPLSLEGVCNFLFKLQSQGCKGGTLNQYVSTCKLWGQYNKVDTYKSLSYFRVKKAIKATMSDTEIESFLKLPPVTVTRPHGRTGKEMTYVYGRKGYDLWTLFFSIMAYTGMRPGEVAHLTINTVDFGQNVFILEDTKTNTPRKVPIPPNLYEPIKAHIDTLKGKYLFQTERGGISKSSGEGVVSEVDWHYNFHQRIKRLGIKRNNLSPYSLRHSFITTMLSEDVNLFKVQKLVGHKQIATTAHYTHLTTKDLQQTITKHPAVRRATSPQIILRAIQEVIKNFQLDNDSRFTYSLNETENSLAIEVKIK